METAHVTSKGQLVIPARLRKKYGITSGTAIRFIERENEILLQPVTSEYIRSVRGMLKSKISATRELLEERSREIKREEVNLGKRGA
jgi:AbrB family looped-hinge helix DNA binding protein